MSTYNYKPGLCNAASFQVSGIPSVTGGIDLSAGDVSLDFPSVTSWIVVSVGDSSTCNVGFSLLGVQNENYLKITGTTVSPRFEIKATQLHLSGTSADVSVMAGLTYITPDSINNVNISPSGSNWSGSLNALVG